MHSNEPKRDQKGFKISETNTNSNRRNNNVLKDGANNEINENYSDEIIHYNYFYKDLAIQINTNDQTVRTDTVQDLKEFNNQFLTTQAKKTGTTCFYDAWY